MLRQSSIEAIIYWGQQGPAEAGALLRQRLLRLGRLVAPAVMQRRSRLRVSGACKGQQGQVGAAKKSRHK